jgi:hypothetical protein
VTGQIRHGAANRPVPGLWAVLHEVRRDTLASGPLDSTRTDAAGRYRVSLPRVDSTAVYFVSTNYQSIGYFSGALRVEGGRRQADVDPILVYDTTTTGSLRLARRMLAFHNTEREAREVLELIEIENTGTHTRIAPDSLTPVWTILLPPGAAGWEVGEGDLSPAALSLSGDTVKVFAPIWPGGPRAASYHYTLPGSQFRIRLDQRTEEFDVLLQDTTGVVSGARFDALGIYDIEGRRFAAYRTGALPAGTEISVSLSRPPLRPEQLVPYIAGLAALALGWGLWVALKRRPAVAPAVRPR